MKTYQDRTDNKVYSWLITIGLHLLLLLMFFFASMAIPEVEEEIQGIVVNFGTVEAANNSEKMASSTESQPATTSEAASASSETSAAAEKVIDQKIEDSNQEETLALSNATKEESDKAEDKNEDKPFERKSDNKNDSPFKRKSDNNAEKQNEEKVEEQKLVDRLFTRKNNDTGTATQGNDENAENADKGQNTENNNQESNNYENNLDTELAKNGISHSLNGRFITKQPIVKKGFQKIGRVVVNIKVNQAGEVISVEQNLGKSTTNDTNLVTSALQSARTTKFNQDFNASVRQSGTISFEYKVR